MEIKRYFLSGNLDLDVSAAVRDTMSLYSATDAGVWPDDNNVLDLPDTSIIVENTICLDAGQVWVKMVIRYWQQENILAAVTAELSRPWGSKGVGYGEDSVGVARRLIRLNVFELMRQITGINSGPWGILRGVRPTKIVHRLLDQGNSRTAIIDSLMKDYAVRLEKAELVTGIAIHQRPFIAQQDKIGAKQVSIYIGVPYCPSRCLYCSFPSYVLPEQREQLEAFFKAIQADIVGAASIISKYHLTVENIYIGGGTPTSLPTTDLDRLLTLSRQYFWGPGTREFTVEAGRPDSLNDEKIDVLRQCGATRVSINPQTMQDKTLKQIGRQHTVQDIIDIFGKIRRAQIPVINMDVIAGLPGETEADMDDTMRQISALDPENITVHTLALKRGSILKETLTAGTFSGQALPNEQTTQTMLEIAATYAANLNMSPYYLYRQKYMTGNLENVGYAKSATECLYNVQIMEERQTIIGIGPAAGTKAVNADSLRLQSCYNAKDVTHYIKNLSVYLNERNMLLTRLYGSREED